MGRFGKIKAWIGTAVLGKARFIFGSVRARLCADRFGMAPAGSCMERFGKGCEPRYHASARAMT